MDILVDVDCVLGDFVGAVCQLAGDPDREKATGYNWFEHTYDEKKVKEIKYLLGHSAAFWQNLPLIPNAKEGIEFLRSQGHKITYLTAPYRPKYGWAWDRRFFLNNNFQIREHDENIIFTHKKGMVRGLCLIDDLISNIDEWEAGNPQGLGLLFGSELSRQSGRELVNWEDIIGMRFFQRGKFM